MAAVFNNDGTKLMKHGVNLNWVVLAERRNGSEFWVPLKVTPAEMPKLLHAAKKSEFMYDERTNALVNKEKEKAAEAA